MSWVTKKVSDFADVVTGGTPSTSNSDYWTNGTIPWLPSGACQNCVINSADTFITELGLRESAAKMMPPDTVVIALTGATTGKVGLLAIDACANQSVTGILPNDTYSSMYLFHYLQSIRDKVIGDSYGGAQKHISQGYVKSMEILFPPLDIQRRIAAVLDKAQSLIAARREQIAVLDKLSKDLFIDMFGDMNTNPMKWEMKNLLAVASIDTHMTSDFEKYADCYHIGIENIEKNSGAIINPTKVKDSGLISGKYPFDSRHIIYSKIRPNLNKVALPDFVGLCSADSYPILPKNDVCDRIYLAFVMRSEFFLSYILDFSGRSNIPKVNKQQLSSFNLPTPPIELQREFAKKVTAINCQKSRLVESLTELETLYKSLTQRAFAGELFT